MLGHRRVTPSIKSTGTHLYTWVGRALREYNKAVNIAQEYQCEVILIYHKLLLISPPAYTV